MFLKNKKLIFKIRRSKVTDYAALNKTIVIETKKLYLFGHLLYKEAYGPALADVIHTKI